MKIKPIYLYGVLVLLVIVVLIIATQQSGSTVPEEKVITDQQIPDDEIHTPFKSKEPPTRDNVSPNFKHKLEMLEKAVKENPGDTLSLREYADLLAAAHKKQESLAYYKKILEADPTRIDIRFSLSYVYYSLGDLKNAEDQTKQILVLEPDNTNAQYNLGAINASLGNKEKAKEIWAKIAKEHPNEEVGIKALESINMLK